MSDKLREALEVIGSMPIPEQDNMVSANMRKIATEAIAADDAARRKVRGEFADWAFDQPDFATMHPWDVARSAWQAASRAAAPQSAEPVAEVTFDELVALVGKDIAPMIDGGTLAHTLSDTEYVKCEVTARDVAVARALLFVVSGSALLDGDKKAIRDAGALYRMICAANNLLIGHLSTRPQQAAPTEADRLDAERYRWLRDQKVGDLAICAWDARDDDWAWDTRAAAVVDAAIDAAMSAQAGWKDQP